MKKMIQKIAGILLLAVLVCGLLPMTAEAAAPENSFVLVAEAGGRLVIAPEYVFYETGWNIGQALEKSEHSFMGLEDNQVYAIDGVGGNYTRSDQTGNYLLTTPAFEVTHYRFSENVGSSQPSEGLMALMTAMADYLLEEPDVQAAAKTAYDTAYDRFVGATDQEAADLAEDLTEAVKAYKDAVAGSTRKVSFSGFTNAKYPGIVIIAKNTYGKVWTDDGDGQLALPEGNYTFHIEHEGLHIEGSLMVEDADQTVSAAFPTGTWLKTDNFKVSATNDPSGGSDQDTDFATGVFTDSSWEGRTCTVPVKDTFLGTIYTYAEYDKSCFAQDVVPELTAVYEDASGKTLQTKLAFESRKIGPTNVLAKGGTGNQVIYRVSTVDETGYTISQDYTVNFVRIPTLTGIEVKDQDGIGQAATTQFADDETEYTYKVLDTVKSLTLTPRMLSDEYTYTVQSNGQVFADGAAVPVNGETVITVVVSCGDYSNTYTLTVLPGEGRKITFHTTEPDIKVKVVNSDGVVLPFKKINDAGTKYQYVLVPGEEYHYIASQDDRYFAEDDFTLEDAANSTIDVAVRAEDWLEALAFGRNDSKDSFKLDTVFSPADHVYSISVPDNENQVYVWATTAAGTTITVHYDQLFNSELYHGKPKEVDVTSGEKDGKKLNRVLLLKNPYGNTVTVRLSKEVGGITYYQDYQIELARTLSLQNLQTSCGSDTVLLNREDGETGYVPSVYAYTVTVPMAADSLVVQPKVYENISYYLCYGEKDNGYTVLVNGKKTFETAEVQLSGTLETETVTISLSSSKTNAEPSVYTIQVQKAAPTVVSLNMTPADALLCVHETASGNRVWPDGTTLNLSEGFLYEYTLTLTGYVGQKGTLVVKRDENGSLVLQHNEEELPIMPAEDGRGGTVSLSLHLEKAAYNQEIKTNIISLWPDFRGSSDNNGVTDAPVPTQAENGTLYWANKIGDGMDADAVGSPILVDGDLITYAGDKLYRVDTVTGEILATGQMDHKSSFSITPPTYYEGMLFVALSDGTVQAFNADTLESLWIYEDPVGGQPNSPIAVCDGYLYTGFWNSETENANFICLSVTDEDPSRDNETKPATWYDTRKGGFYWAGAYATNEWVLVGTDDGEIGCTSPSSQLLLLDAKTGKLLDSWDGLNGDIRSTVAYDSETDAYYFTSKGGSFYSVKVTNGTLIEGRRVDLQNGTAGTPMSTSTPVIYNKRAYLGVSGAGQFTSYSGHSITVIDLEKKAIAYRATTQGYPQTSGLLTTAYEENSGCVYVYFFDNDTPGKLRVLRDKAGQTSPDYLTMEAGTSTPYNLFTPVGPQAQYVICSPIVDEYGTVYFKNDSAYLMAFGSRIAALDVTGELEKKQYAVGETFDPTGITVTATYANGETRDVTKYVTASAIEAGDTAVTLTFPYVMYHNQENGRAMNAGVQTTAPTVVVEGITVKEPDPATEISVCEIGTNIVTLTFDGGVQTGWTVYGGLYDQNGKMVAITSVPGNGRLSVELNLPGAGSAYEFRAFVLNGDNAPEMKNLSVVKQGEKS